jgi:SAM-dependent methyltransferase
MDVKEETILGDKALTHWYYVAKGRALRAMLKSIKVPEIVDVGAGSGLFAKLLIEAGICRSAICVDPAYADEREERYLGRSIHFVRSIDTVTQSLVLMMDVLEHVDDDVGLIRQYAECMPQAGKILVTVPAFGFLWSGHDVFLEHRRRYTLLTIEKRLRMADLKVLRSQYFFGTLFPFVMLVRTVNRWQLESGSSKAASMLKNYPPIVNKIFTYIHDFERLLFFPINRFAGLSIFCLAEKR